MPDPSPQALNFLLTRRSRPARTLGPPYPDRAALMPILTAAARSPDHGKLEPWRFLVFSAAALQRLAGLALARGTRLALDPDENAKAADQFAQSGCAVAVVSAPRENPKIPLIEQRYSAGAVCVGLLNAALASGWGANWLSGWPAHDRVFLTECLGLAGHESVAGFIHLGSETAAPPERPRPDLDAITTWVEA